MAGHSKWANIQHRKSKQDAKRGKLFTKLIREITVSARMGGGDASANPRLRAAIDAALANNMTKDTIERAVKRGAGGDEGDNVEEIRYEGYGPGGTAIIVDCMSDNRNRTVAEVRHTFNKYGGNLGTDGSVAYLFNECGVIYCRPGNDEDQLLAVALEAGADDIVNNDDGSVDVVTSFAGFHAVKGALEKAGIAIDSSETTMRAATSSRLDLDHARSLITLVDMLEDLDDVQRVYSNADIPQDILEQLG